MSDFKEYWSKINTDAFTFEKAEALTNSELTRVRDLIEEKTNKGWISSKIIKLLQAEFPKLASTYRAEMAYWTEVKKLDTTIVVDAGEDLDVDLYKVILSPNACELCIQKTDGGKKIFTQEEASKTGYGEFVPWHPQCYCIAVPYVK